MGMAWGLAYQWSRYRLFAKQIDDKGFEGLFWGNFVLTWVGAKVFYLIFSGSFDMSYSPSFWFGGGFVFFGGLVFGTAFTLYYCLKLKQFPLRHLSFFLPVVTVAHGIGRIGCFLTGCCFGSQTDLPW